MSDAIQTDVSSEIDSQSSAGEREVEVQLTEAEQQAAREQTLKNDMNPRERVINDIAARFERARAESLGLEVDDDGGEDEKALAAERQVEQEAPRDEKPQAPRAPADLPVYQGDDGQYYMKLKVNGQEQAVPVSKVQATMQKHAAADQRLQHASQVQREAEERLRLAQERELQLQRRFQPPGEGAATSDESLGTAKAFIDKLLDSEPEAAAESLARLLDSRTPRIDVEAIKQDVTREVFSAAQRQEKQRSLEVALKNFESKYSRIVEDPDLFQLADQKTVEIMREKPYLTHEQVLEEAGEYIARKFLGGVATPRPSSQSSNERQTRKQGLRPIPRGSSHAQPRAQEPAAPTPASVVAQMRKARGLGG